MAAVHWQQPGFKAKSETDGHGDTCGPIVIQDYMYLKDPANWQLSNVRLDALRSDLINAGLMNVKGEAGMTIGQIAGAFRRYGVTPLKVVTYNGSLDFQTFRQDLIAALTAHQLVVMETTYAYKLPNNQPNVNYHFVLFGGIDSVQGYWVANGDAEYALGVQGAVDPYWVGVQPIQACVPCGYIILPALDIAPVESPLITLEKDGSGNITGGHDQNGNHIGSGFALAAQQQNLLALDITCPERSVTVAGGGDIQVCTLGHVFVGTWTENRPVRLDTWFEVAQSLEALFAKIDAPAPTPPPPPPPAPKPNYTQSWNSIETALDALHAELNANGEV